MRLLVSSIAVLALAGCGNKPVSFSKVVEDFVYSNLALTPAGATAAGYHNHNGVALDELIDDYSAGGLEAQRRFYRDFRARLGAFQPEGLSPEDRADYEIIDGQIGLGLLELDVLQDYRHNPTLYVELAGNALNNCYLLEYAPKEKRFQHIIARLEKLPALMEQAKKNLMDSPEIWNQVAREENEGNIALIDKTIRPQAPAELRASYDQAAASALAALRGFNDFLSNVLSKRPSDWRLGKEKYAQKFRAVLHTDGTPEQLLGDAEKMLQNVREDMRQLAARLDPKASVPAVVAKIAARHSTRDGFLADARRDLEETTQFVKSKGLLALPARSNLQVIETPEFVRGIYAVGGFNPAPALEPQLGAFYWITPIPKDWPAARVESKLREDNYYGLKILTIHEAMPGHYVQAEYAHDIEPKSRRVLRDVFSNGPYAEGWAVYATEVMLDEGYLENSPELRLMFHKQILRVLANTILDVRMQTMGMTDQQALDLMTGQTYQEDAEATAKLQRAKLSSCQLPMYFTGWHGWRGIRERYQKAKGSGFKLAEFHERALKEGAVPLPVLERLLARQ